MGVVHTTVTSLRGEWMDGQAHPTHGDFREGCSEYLVVVVDPVGRFRDAYGPYALAAAHREAARHRRALTEAGEHTVDVRIARHHPVAIPLPRGPWRPDA